MCTIGRRIPRPRPKENIGRGRPFLAQILPWKQKTQFWQKLLKKTLFCQNSLGRLQGKIWAKNILTSKTPPLPKMPPKMFVKMFEPPKACSPRPPLKLVPQSLFPKSLFLACFALFLPFCPFLPLWSVLWPFVPPPPAHPPPPRRTLTETLPRPRDRPSIT